MGTNGVRNGCNELYGFEQEMKAAFEFAPEWAI